MSTELSFTNLIVDKHFPAALDPFKVFFLDDLESVVLAKTREKVCFGWSRGGLPEAEVEMEQAHQERHPSWAFKRDYSILLVEESISIFFHTTINLRRPQYLPQSIMACADPLLQLDDQSFALQLQLQELDDQRERQTGKWTEDNPPDFALAFDDFHAELMKLASLVEDVKLAHSIAKAVDSDATAIEELRAEEAQSIQDRGFALSLNENGNLPSQVVTDVPELSGVCADSTEWNHVLRATEASTLSIYSASTVAGPSTQYADRQRAVFEQLPQLKVECTICGESTYPHHTVRLACKDVYCKPCLKEFFLRLIKDESLFPPKCHRQLIDITLIEAELSVEELAAYRRAELEFSSTNRLYCADPQCAAFIPLPQRAEDHASCEVCGATTCVHCKALAHEGGCTEDEARQSLVHFADEQGWKACFGCGEMVYRYEGCNHMT